MSTAESTQLDDDPRPGTGSAAVQPEKGSKPFRMDVQTLRALAIVIVIVYHYWPSRLTGGFVGVDVFFVVSGYLITAHLVRDAQKQGRLSLSKFWSRRARRLLPAAFVVLLFCIPVALFFLRARTEQNLTEIIAAALYVENWTLALNSIDYVAAENLPSLVQHFWSLSVEEQFYIAWPVIILIACLVATKARMQPSTAILFALTALFLISLFHSVAITFARPDQAYFLTTARVWEFAAGGLTSLIPVQRLGRLTTRPGSFMLAWLGLFGIIVSAVVYSDDTAFPGYSALLPVVATVAVLVFGNVNSRLSVARVTNIKPIRFTADISYSLYLWHWPLLILTTALLGNVTALPKLVVIGISFVAAYLTKRFVEDPARFSWRWMQTRRGAFGFAAASIAAVIALSAGANGIQHVAYGNQLATIDANGQCVGARAMLPESECDNKFAYTATVDPAATARDVFWREGSVQASGVCAPKKSQPTSCILGSTESPVRTVAFIGSSHGQHLLDPLDTAMSSLNWKLLPHTRARCSGFDSPEQIAIRISDDPSLAEDIRECERWADSVFDLVLNSSKVSVVVVSARSIGATDFVVERVNKLKAAGKQVIWLGDTPDLPTAQTAPSCVEAAEGQDDPCVYAAPVTSEREVAEMLGVPYIDMQQNFCDEKGCHVVIGGLITFFDNNHLSLTFAKTLSTFLERSLGKAVTEMSQ